jgi:hypothetical protein
MNISIFIARGGCRPPGPPATRGAVAPSLGSGGAAAPHPRGVCGAAAPPGSTTFPGFATGAPPYLRMFRPGPGPQDRCQVNAATLHTNTPPRFERDRRGPRDCLDFVGCRIPHVSGPLAAKVRAQFASLNKFKGLRPVRQPPRMLQELGGRPRRPTHSWGFSLLCRRSAERVNNCHLPGLKDPPPPPVTTQSFIKGKRLY